MPPIETRGKRSDPQKQLRELEAAIKDMESRLPPDSEDPESILRRRAKFGSPPVRRGGLVTGFKKRNLPV